MKTLTDILRAAEADAAAAAAIRGAAARRDEDQTESMSSHGLR